MKIIHRILFVLQFITGIGAVVGGAAAILNPMSPLGMPAEALKNSPFDDFLIPGILLFTILGLGNILAAIFIVLKSKYVGYMGCICGGAMFIWIVVQCIMLSSIHFLHITFFTVGVIQAILSMMILYKQNLFPMNLLKTYTEKIQNRQSHSG